jgi:uncharacterized small protein (TIGR04563 family)
MLDFLRTIQIDWHYDEASPQIRKVLPAANQSLSSTDHTFDTFREQLRELAGKHLDIVADAFVEDAYRQYWLFRVRTVPQKAGMSLREIAKQRVEEIEVGMRFEDGAKPVELPYDDVVDDVPLEYADEAEMRAAVANVQTSGAFVADAGFERFLVELAPEKTVIRKVVPAVEAALVGRLRRGEYKAVPAPPRVADEKYEQALYWPESMLTFLTEQAVRTDRSLSNLVQEAFNKARKKIAASDREELAEKKRVFDGETRRQSLYFRGDMLDEMAAEAARLDSSLSFVAQSAVALARDAILALAED